MPNLEPPKNVPVRPEDRAAHEAASKPGPADVHEQRQQERKKQEAVVEKSASRPPTQSIIDEERGDWEGMGQGSPKPD